jgi:enoyl-CoA hydratase
MLITILRGCVGEKHAYDIISTARRIRAAHAERIGLVSRVLPASSFAHDVNQIAAEIASTSPTAQRITKQLFYALDTLDFRAGVSAGMRANVDARMTDDFRTSVLAFANRGK